MFRAGYCQCSPGKITGKFSEAAWQHFAVLLQMSSHSSGRGKPYSFLYKTSHCLSVLEYDLAYNKHLSGENALVEKAPLLLPQKKNNNNKKSAVENIQH